MTDPRDSNRELWDELAGLHVETAWYDVPGFLTGRCTLRSIERQEVGDPAGRSLLHLQCHIGLDTLSLARLGARVTGVDFAPRAVEIARRLAQQADLSADFVCSPVEELPDRLTGSFDLVFSSYGVLCWLADLPRWARVIAHFLRPGGHFHLVELHPVADMLEDGDSGPRFVSPYFGDGQPIAVPTRGSYADRSTPVSKAVSYQYAHSLGEIIGALLNAGLRLDWLREFPLCPYQRLAGMVDNGDGYWRFPEGTPALPLLFSLRATKGS